MLPIKSIPLGPARFESRVACRWMQPREATITGDRREVIQRAAARLKQLADKQKRRATKSLRILMLQYINIPLGHITI